VEFQGRGARPDDAAPREDAEIGPETQRETASPLASAVRPLLSVRLLPVIVCSLAAGILVARPLPAVLLLLPALFFPRLSPHRVAVLAFLAGNLLPGPAPEPPLARIFPEGSHLVSVTGVAATGADRPVFGRTEFILDLEQIGGHDLPGRLRVLLPEGAPLPDPGDRVFATGLILRPRPAMNPGEPDSRADQARKGVSHLLSVRTPRSLVILEPASSLSPRTLLFRLRRAFDARVARLRSPILSCLLVGRRREVPEATADAFRRSGTAHVLAISGLHVGLLAGMLWLVLRCLPIPRAISAALVALAALVYAGVTGFRPPAARASLLIALAATGVACRRGTRPLHLLFLAALFLLLSDETTLTRTGFLLSFTAVLSILTLSRPLSRGLFARQHFLDRFSVPGERPWPIRILRAYLIRAVPVSLAAWFGTAPIVLDRFGTFPFLVVPANLVVLPIVTLLVPIGLVGALTGIGLPAVLLARLLVLSAGLFAAIPGACATLPPPPLPVILAWYAVLLLAARSRSIGRWRTAGLVTGLLLVAASGPLLRRAPEEPRLTVISVGHGLATVLETPEGGVLIVDAGSRRPALFRRVLLPYLRDRRITAVDALVLSHDDLDHTSGACDFLRVLPVRQFRPPGSIRAGDGLDVPGAVVTVLAPRDPVPGAGNDDSTVLRVRAGGLTILYPGDIEEDGVRRLLLTGHDLTADVLILPHHGHPNPGAAALTRAVNPKTIIASAGPGAALDPLWEGALRTSEMGAITIYADGRRESYLGGSWSAE